MKQVTIKSNSALPIFDVTIKCVSDDTFVFTNNLTGANSWGVGSSVLGELLKRVEQVADITISKPVSVTPDDLAVNLVPYLNDLLPVLKDPELIENCKHIAKVLEFTDNKKKSYFLEAVISSE